MSPTAMTTEIAVHQNPLSNLVSLTRRIIASNGKEPKYGMIGDQDFFEIFHTCEKILMQQWRQSDCRKALKARLGRFSPLGSWKLQRCILFGVGNIVAFDPNSSPNQGLIIRRPFRCIMQMVVFKDIASLVQAPCKPNGQPIELFVQEPRFTSIDKMAALKCGIHTLNNPRAQEMMDESTLVMAPFVGMEQEFLAAEDRQPAILVGLALDRILLNSMRKYQADVYGGDTQAFHRTITQRQLNHQRVLATEHSYEHFRLCEGPDCEFNEKNNREGHQFQDLWVHVKKSKLELPRSDSLVVAEENLVHE